MYSGFKDFGFWRLTISRAHLVAGFGRIHWLEAKDVLSDSAVAKVSLVGAGMKTNPGVSATMFETLAANEINIEMISTSPIRITCVVRGEQVERAVVALHDAFGLE